MASVAEVDLVISTAETLPDLERDLQRIIRIAEGGAPELDVEAALAVGESLSNLAGQLDQVVQAAEQGASEIELEAALDTQRSLSHIQGQIESIVQRASQGEDIDLQAELDRVGSLTQVSNQLRSLVNVVEANAPPIELEVEVDRDGRGERSALNLGRVFTSLSGSLPNIPVRIAAIGSALIAAVPAAAALTAAVESILPASALAVSGLTALALVGVTTTLAFQGMGEAVKNAFDPDVKPEDLAKSLERLAPNARAFVLELRSMRSGLREIQQAVQQNFFANFDQSLRNLSRSVLPVVSNALRVTSLTLNRMALDVSDAAVALAENGTLGRALSSANIGLLNLAKVPAQVTTALGQLGAAAGPSFERVTAAAAKAATGIADRLSAAFESGALESAISGAVDAIAQLGRIAGNVFEGIGNIFENLNAGGEGLFAVLEKITQAFADVTATKGFQQALTALSDTFGVLVDTVLPLVSQALQILGPVFVALAAPIQILVRALGEGLGKILTALQPVLVAVANAFGQLVILVTPFIDLAAELIAAILPGLVPLFEALGQTLNALVPFAEALVAALGEALIPLFTRLAAEVLPQLLPPLVELSTRLIPVLTEVIIALAPTIAKLAEVFAELLIAATPLIVEILNLGLALADELLPIIQPIIDLVLKLINIAFAVLAAQITGLIIPTIRILVDLLRGDFSAAWQGAQDLIRNVANKIGEILSRMSAEVVRILSDLGRAARDKALQLVNDFISEFSQMGNRAAAIARSLPGIILGALGNLGNLLVSAGGDLIQGLINGIRNKLGALRSIASEAASVVSGSVKDLLGISSPSKVMMEVGNDTMDGFVLGIADRIPDLRKELQGVAALAPSFALPNGQTLKLPQISQSAPTVQVFIGNEQLNGHVDTRIAQNNQARDRLIVQGVRR